MTIDRDSADEIKKFNTLLPRRGFGSIKVLASAGKTKWKTSIFPDKEGVYLLPIKKEVRDKEGIKEGDSVEILLEIRN